MNTQHNVNKHADKLQPYGGATEITHNALSHNGNMKLITSCSSCELRSLYYLCFHFTSPSSYVFMLLPDLYALVHLVHPNCFKFHAPLVSTVAVIQSWPFFCHPLLQLLKTNISVSVFILCLWSVNCTCTYWIPMMSYVVMILWLDFSHFQQPSNSRTLAPCISRCQLMLLLIQIWLACSFYLQLYCLVMCIIWFCGMISVRYSQGPL